MKMKKAYAAALAAAMVLTAGFSVQAANLEGNFTGGIAYDNEGKPSTATTTVSFTGAEVAASLEGQNLNLGDVWSTAPNGNSYSLNATGDKVGGMYRDVDEEGNGTTTIEENTHISANGIVTNGIVTKGDVTSETSNGNVYSLNDTGDKVGGMYRDVDDKGHGTTTIEENTHISENGIVTNGLTADTATVTGELTADKTVTGELKADTATVTGDASVDGTLTAGAANVNGQLTVTGGQIVANNGATINQGATIFGGLTLKDEQGNGVNVGDTLTQHGAAIEQNTAAITNNSQRIDSLSGRVNDLDGEIENVGAISAALAGLHPLSYDGTGSKFQLAAAMGSYEGTQAAAIGGFYHFNEDIMMSVGGATAFDGDSDTAFNVGVSFRVGQGSSGKKVNSDDVLAQLNAMNEKIAALEAENQSLSEKVAALEGSEAAPAEAE